MATIEERAIENSYNYTESEGYRQGYINGAEEQQKIDLDIAMEAFCKHDCEDFLDVCPNRKKGTFCVEYRKFKEVLEQAMKGSEE